MRIRSLFSTALIFAVGVSALFSVEARSASEAPLKAKARLEVTDSEAKTGNVFIELDLEDPYKAYADRFKLVVEEPPGATLEPFQLTPIVQFLDPITKKMKDGIKHSGSMTAKITLPVADPKSVKLKLTYQACTTDHCLFPKHITLEPKVVVLSSSEASARKSNGDVAAAPSSGGEFEKAMSGGLLSAILFMLVAGFLTSLTPCIYPMIPITLAILGARAQNQSKARSFLLSVIYVLGIATTYSILGVTAATTGALFGSALSNVYVVSILALLFVGMGLSMYGLFEIQAPAFLRDRMGQGKTEASYAGSYFTGLAAGIVASPCIGPVLVSVLAYIAQTQNKFLGFTLLFSFAMGMGVLFIVLGTSSSLLGKIPKAGSWMDAVKFVFGTTMIGMAIYYVAPVYPDWAVRGLLGLAMVLISSAYGVFAPAPSGGAQVRKGAAVAAFCVGIALLVTSVLERSGFQLAAANSSQNSSAATAYVKLPWQSYSDAALAKALADKKPVLIDFWAEWCGACHELEEKTFPDARIQDLAKKYVLFKIDATSDSEELNKLKTTYKVMGLPTMIFYDVTGQVRTDLTVTGFMDAPAFLERMNKAL